jgi:hypothetical protein
VLQDPLLSQHQHQWPHVPLLLLLQWLLLFLVSLRLGF